METHLQSNAVHNRDEYYPRWDHSELVGQNDYSQLFPPSSHICNMHLLRLQFQERSYCTAARIMHMSFDMRMKNKTGQDRYNLQAPHAKHVSVWLLVFHPFSSYLHTSRPFQNTSDRRSESLSLNLD
jgi:hypothetical protein